MRRRGMVLAAVVACATACNALSGVGDLVEVADTAQGDGGGPDAAGPEDARGEPDAAGPLPDAADAAPADATAGLCTGLGFVLRFDGDLRSAEGETAQAPPPGNSAGAIFGAGKFGQAVTFTGNTPYVGYDAVFAGVPVVDPRVGTVAMWVKPVGGWQPPCPDGPQSTLFFYVDDNGVFGLCDSYGLDTWVNLSPDSGVGASLGSTATWSTTSFNHIAFTWGSSPKTFGVMLNGGLSATATEAWTPPDPVATNFYVGGEANAAFDDVAVWTRELSAAEVQAVYALGKSVADQCGLP